MAVAKSPSSEALSAITDRVNTGTAYTLDVQATYTDQLVDPLEDVTDLRVDVVHESEEQLLETLDVEDRTSHVIRIWVRKKLSSEQNEEIELLKLLTRQIYQRINDFDSADGRVKVWECDMDPKQIPDKALLRQSWLFVASIVLRCEVEASN
jgi:hypothetical protein